MDYKSVFDKIWHKIWHKIAKRVIGKILKGVYELCQNEKSCVELNGKNVIIDVVIMYICVHQGDSLYPLLFAIFVDDLESYLLQEGNNYLSFVGDARLENMLSY